MRPKVLVKLVFVVIIVMLIVACIPNTKDVIVSFYNSISSAAESQASIPVLKETIAGKEIAFQEETFDRDLFVPSNVYNSIESLPDVSVKEIRGLLYEEGALVTTKEPIGIVDEIVSVMYDGIRIELEVKDPIQTLTGLDNLRYIYEGIEVDYANNKILVDVRLKAVSG